MTDLFVSQQPLYQDTLAGGSHWSFVLKQGLALQLTDLEGGANVGMLFYNPTLLLERYNMPDTLKAQHTFQLTRGHCLYSDMGRIFASIVEDSSGWHDTVCGNAYAALVRKRWGERSYQTARNEYYRNGRDSFLVELGKYGLGKKDMAANLNLFSKVAVDDAGNLQFDTEHAKAGASVTLRFEMDTLVILHTCPHPLNPATEYPHKPVRYELWQAAPVTEDDYCKNACPENRRGFQNNALYQLGLPVPKHDCGHHHAATADHRAA